MYYSHIDTHSIYYAIEDEEENREIEKKETFRYLLINNRLLNNNS